MTEEKKKSALVDNSLNASHLLGSIVRLMLVSAKHRQMSLALIDSLIAPPISLRQLVLASNQTGPIGYASWAFVSKEVERRVMENNHPFAVGDWNSGDMAWVVDLICPEEVIPEMMKLIKKRLKVDQKIHLLLPSRIAGERASVSIY